MKYVFVDVLGARRNPEQNIKTTTRQQLADFIKANKSNINNYYITFTELPKVGINPINRFGTPIGIYSYPLHLVCNEQGILVVPYADNRKYINILLSSVTDKNKILSVKTYGNSKFAQDFESLEKYWNQVKSQFTDESITRAEILIHKYISKQHHLLVGKNKTAQDLQFADVYRIAKIILDTFARNTNLPKKRLFYLWFLTETFSFLLAPNSGADSKYTVVDSPKTNANTVKWNYLLREILGYQLVIDTGLGFIHPNEPTQALFLSKRSLTLETTIVNDGTFKSVQDLRNVGIDKSKPEYLQRFLMTEEEYLECRKVNPDVRLLKTKAINNHELFVLKLVDGRVAITRGRIKFKKPIDGIVYHDFIININCLNANFKNCEFTQQIRKGQTRPEMESCKLENCKIHRYQITESSVYSSDIKSVNVINSYFERCNIQDGEFKTVNRRVFRKTVFRNCKILNGVYENTNFINSQIHDGYFVDCYFKNCTFESTVDTKEIEQNNCIINNK